MSQFDNLSPASISDVVSYFEANGHSAYVDRSGRVFYRIGACGPECQALPLEAWAVSELGRVVPPNGI